MVVSVFKYSIITVTMSPIGCTAGTLRLDNGNDGRLELCIDNVWIGVCSGSNDEIISSIACRQLGFVSGEVLAVQNFGKIWGDFTSNYNSIANVAYNYTVPRITCLHKLHL